MNIARTASISVRVEPEAKEGAEKVLANLGISMSDAINIFCKQITLRQAIPFELELPLGPKELDATNWSKERFMSEIQEGIDDLDAGKVFSEKEVKRMLREKMRTYEKV